MSPTRSNTFGTTWRGVAALVMVLGLVGVTAACSSEAPPPAGGGSVRTTTPIAAPATSGIDGGASVLALGFAAVIGFAIGAAVTYLLVSYREEAAIVAPTTPPRAVRPAASPATTVSPPAPVGVATAPGLDALVPDLIALRDLVEPNSVVASRLAAALDRVGVHESAPVGEVFDASYHHAVGVAATRQPGEADRVAEVQRVGYYDQRRIIRAPEVVVYRLDGGP